MEINRKVVRTPTKGRTPVALDVSDNELTYVYREDMCVHEDFVFQHLHIISNEDGKEGDWRYFESNDGLIRAVTQNLVKTPGRYKEIIATTDKTLKIKVIDYNADNQPKYNPVLCTFSGKNRYKKVSLPRLSEEFVKDYCESKSINEVVVECEVKCKSISALCTASSFNKGCPSCEYRLKVDSSNTITVSLAKDSWSREEVEGYMRKAFIEGGKSAFAMNGQFLLGKFINKMLN